MSSQSTFRSWSDQPLSLIETLRYTPGEGCIRAERHLARMKNSAEHFGKKLEISQAKSLLQAIDSNDYLRVRLLLDSKDELSLETHPFVAVTANTVWRVAIAEFVALNSHDPYLPHKTSRRSHYDQARSEFGLDEIDEVVLLNQAGHVCEGTITTIFIERAGRLLTPPLADGLLLGVLRQELLETGLAVESVLLPDDLKTEKLYVGNSLRGLIPAILKS